LSNLQVRVVQHLFPGALSLEYVSCNHYIRSRFFREAIAAVVSVQFVFHVFRNSLLQNLPQAILMAASSSDVFSTASDFVRSAAVLQEGQLEAADADEAQGGVLVRIHTNDYLASEALDRIQRSVKIISW
jgi:hypothetical protein